VEYWKPIEIRKANSLASIPADARVKTVWVKLGRASSSWYILGTTVVSVCTRSLVFFLRVRISICSGGHMVMMSFSLEKTITLSHMNVDCTANRMKSPLLNFHCRFVKPIGMFKINEQQFASIRNSKRDQCWIDLFQLIERRKCIAYASVRSYRVWWNIYPNGKE